jgi:hypothetical protein
MQGPRIRRLTDIGTVRKVLHKLSTNEILAHTRIIIQIADEYYALHYIPPVCEAYTIE